MQFQEASLYQFLINAKNCQKIVHISNEFGQKVTRCSAIKNQRANLYLYVTYLSNWMKQNYAKSNSWANPFEKWFWVHMSSEEEDNPGPHPWNAFSWWRARAHSLAGERSSSKLGIFFTWQVRHCRVAGSEWSEKSPKNFEFAKRTSLFECVGLFVCSLCKGPVERKTWPRHTKTMNISTVYELHIVLRAHLTNQIQTTP